MCAVYVSNGNAVSYHFHFLSRHGNYKSLVCFAYHEFGGTRSLSPSFYPSLSPTLIPTRTLLEGCYNVSPLLLKKFLLIAIFLVLRKRQDILPSAPSTSHYERCFAYYLTNGRWRANGDACSTAAALFLAALVIRCSA